MTLGTPANAYASPISAPGAVIYHVTGPGEGFSPRNLRHAAVADPPRDAYSHVEVRSRLVPHLEVAAYSLPGSWRTN
jgi:hypothetical protein